MMKYFLFIMFFSVTLISAQTDWERWDKAEVTYSDNTNLHDNDSRDLSLLSLLKEGYSFFISDLDGDNCPFYPTCSNFFVESVSRTNIFQGTLMFADRFTRDSNLFKSHNHYPYRVNGHYYDPVCNYLLKEYEIEVFENGKIISR